MRFHSTPQSALNGEITKLAIIECVLSIALYLWIGVHFKTFRHLAVAVIAAPLMLFRTEASADWGLAVYAQIVEKLKGEVDGLSVKADHRMPNYYLKFLLFVASFFAIPFLVPIIGLRSG
jgi:hypothetical protein